jgi:hypothetical protein
VDYYRNSRNPVVARLFWSEHKPKFPTNRWLDSYLDRHCRDTHRLEAVGGHIDPRFVENMAGSQTGCLPYDIVTKGAQFMQSKI